MTCLEAAVAKETLPTTALEEQRQATESHRPGSTDFIWKGAITRHMEFRARGRPKRCEHKTNNTTAPGPPAPRVVVFVLFSHICGRPCARNPLWRLIVPPYLAHGHI
eukprot:6339454-Heterocapsa_arctica.AAC.1